VFAPHTGVVAPEFVLVIEVQGCRGFGPIHFQEGEPEIAALECIADGDRHLLPHFGMQELFFVRVLNHQIEKGIHLRFDIRG